MEPLRIGDKRQMRPGTNVESVKRWKHTIEGYFVEKKMALGPITHMAMEL